MIDRDYGERRGFNFEAYLIENPYGRASSRSYRIAAPSRWSFNQIPSTVTLADIARYRERFHIPSDVHLYIPESYERADQAPDGLVAVDELIMEAGFRFPLHYAVSYLLDSWNLAPLQLTSNAWLTILCTYVLFGQYKLKRLLTAAETNFLYKLANTRRTTGGHHLQPRLGRVVFGVPNRVHGDPGKWFWVGGSWKAYPCDHPSTSQCPPAELEIPTDFRIRNPSPRIPSARQLSFDFLVVWNKVRDLPQSERHVSRLNSERARLEADLFRYPRHARIPDRRVVRYLHPPEEMKKYSTLINRFQELAQSRRAAPQGLTSQPAAEPEQETGERPPPPRTDLPPAAEVAIEAGAGSPPRTPGRKKKRLVKAQELMIAGKKSRRSPPHTRARSPSRIVQRSSAQPVERSPPPAPEGDTRLSIGGPSRGTFLEEVAAHVRRATDDLPRAWNAELEEVAGRRSLETAQAALTHALQTSVLMAKVVNDLEGGPDVARLQMQLERAVKSLGESQQRLAAAEEQNKKLELDCQQAASAIEQLKAYLERAMTNVEEGRRLVVARNLEIAGLQERIETKTGEAADSAAELARRTEELSLKTAALASAAADLEAARNEIAALKTQLKEADRSPSPDAALVGEFSYYMAFADSLRVSSKAGVEVGPLVELLRGYATENPMHPDYPLPILDLQTVHGIDLSWYPRPEQLVLPPADEPATADGDAAEGSKAAGGDDAAA
ncbi:hypothetical protein OROGR_016364 [Orobanche gracilis]